MAKFGFLPENVYIEYQGKKYKKLGRHYNDLSVQSEDGTISTIPSMMNVTVIKKSKFKNKANKVEADLNPPIEEQPVSRIEEIFDGPSE